MKIFVRPKTHYNKQFYYPDCGVSKLFCELTGTKTLTIEALQLIKRLNYDVCIKTAVVIPLEPAPTYTQ